MKTYRTQLKQEKELLYSKCWSDEQVGYLQILTSFPLLFPIQLCYLTHSSVADDPNSLFPPLSPSPVDLRDLPFQIHPTPTTPHTLCFRTTHSYSMNYLGRSGQSSQGNRIINYKSSHLLLSLKVQSPSLILLFSRTSIVAFPSLQMLTWKEAHRLSSPILLSVTHRFIPTPNSSRHYPRTCRPFLP